MPQAESLWARDEVIRQYDGLYINGRWEEPHSADVIESIDPATGNVWAVVPCGDAEDVDAAVRAARRAFETSPWNRCRGEERGRLLRRLADLVAERADELAVLETRDNGKAIREVRLREVPSIPEKLTYFAGLADKIQGDTIPVNPDVQVLTLREPIGVVGAIIPWNGPLSDAAGKIAPAIAAGNTIVIKPAEYTAVTALELTQLVEEAGFPPGVVNVVTGYGVPTGEALVDHIGVDKIAFTGEIETARAITKHSTANLKRLSFELGGKSANIIFADCDYDTAVAATAEAAFIAAGQSCSLGSRIFVEEKIFEHVVADLVDVAMNVRVGDPLDEKTEMGPQTSLEQLEKIEWYVDSAREAGAEIVCGGERTVVPGFEGGYFYRPTIISDVTPDMAVFQDEIFGPVVTVMSFKSEEEVIGLANATRYGLAAGFWTTDLRRAHRMAQALKAGTVWINTFRSFHWAAPFGGVKLSGYGRENGLEVISEYTQVKTVVTDHRDDRPKWFSGVS